MYAPEGLGTSLDEKSIRAKPKEIVHMNTGFQGQDLLVVNQTAAAKFDPTQCRPQIIQCQFNSGGVVDLLGCGANYL